MVELTEVFERVLEIIKNGGVVVVPTETAYALAADATNSTAVERVQKIKGREIWKTPPLIVSSIEMAEQYLEITQSIRPLVEKYWPGPLTIIGKTKESALAPLVIREDKTIAVRVTSHESIQQISALLGVPIVATSANLSGRGECYSVADIQKQFEGQPNQPDLYFDAGILSEVPPSTIIKEENEQIIVLRQGSVVIL